MQHHPRFVASDGEHILCGRVPSVPEDMTGTARMTELVLQTIGELQQKLGDAMPTAKHVLLALPEPRPGAPSGHGRIVQRALSHDEARWPHHLQISVNEQGHAAGLACLREAHALITAGREDLCIVGGADSYLESDTIDWMEAERRLACEGNRNGLVRPTRSSIRDFPWNR